LLGKDGLLIKLIINRVGEKVTAGCEISGALNGAVANNSVLGGRDRRKG
jgi:hypothetical protein